MNEEALIAALGAASQTDSAEYRAAAEAVNAVRGAQEASKKSLLHHELAKPIEAVLRTRPPFEGGPGFLIAGDNGYTGFHAAQAAGAIVRFVLEGASPAEAVARLRAMVSVQEANGLGVLALIGPEVESPIDLYEGIRLIPFEALSASGQKDRLLDDVTADASRSFVPKSALTVNHTIRPVLFPANASPPKQDSPLALWNLLHDARLALTLVGLPAPVALAYWFQYEIADHNSLGIGMTMTSRRARDPWLHGPSVKILPDDARRVVTAFLSLKGPLKPRLHLSLSRLNQALCEPPHGDRALDLAIALESLLVSGSGELTYRLALRSALLTAGDEAARSRIRGVVSALYEVRSGLIHNGVMPARVKVKPGGRMDSAALVEEATVACRDILRTILFRGELPDWDLLEINGSDRRIAAK